VTATEHVERRQRGTLISAGAIDCDVHQMFPQGPRAALEPYLDDAWCERIWAGSAEWGTEGPGAQFAFPLVPYFNPGNNLRADAVPPSGGPPASDPAFTTADLLDRYDLGAAVLLGGNVLTLGGLPDVDMSAALASAYNDWQRNTWLEADPRYWGSIVVTSGDPGKAAAEIHRMAADERFVQVFLNHHGMAIGNRHYYPIYEAAVEHGLPVSLHPGMDSGAGRFSTCFALDPPSYYMGVHTAMDQPSQMHVISLITEGVFERFPELKVGMIEMGYAWLPAVAWKLDKNWKGLRREVPWITQLPSLTIKEHIRFTTQPMPEAPDPRHVDYLMEMIDGEQILMFSTDYPHWDGDDPNVVMRSLDETLRERILWRNALEFLRVPPQASHPAWSDLGAS
jgi:predicted TIM-barrel fold metal-dependent hydrolase